ncbi:MAG: hypothetical protein COB12_07165 [Flavobacterium sp.]|nr:MAG: hypothetical protein COB12_07165 [Flavobacterium sp.]
MKSEKEVEEFYKRLKEQLISDTTWPAEYYYKFIIPASLDKIAEIEAIFDATDAVITTRDSKTGKYTSLSIKVKLNSPDIVIEKYMEVSKIEGVISL